ncbi:MAG TPA: CotH kinase family protein [Phycisphaerae bacterium]|nr:CotH kinase family protein [Phycisphaerae bacterium]HUU23519.1 CotH kinase family protein [Phycisphaerae bacterium]
MRTRWLFVCAGVVAAAIWGPAPARGEVADWPGLYDPFQILDLQVTMEPADLAVIRADETFDIEKPAWLSVPGETPVLVSIRRKSGDPIGGKLSYKVDINEYVDGQRWHGVRKLSLENGDDQDVVSEGFAWFLQQQAATLDNGYAPGMANWANLTINGAAQGLYVNVEQVDESFLKNRNLWVSHETWLYKQSDISHPTIKEQPADPTLINTTMEALNYSPFDPDSPVPTPDPATLAAQLRQYIHMDTMLSLGAVEAVTDGGDSLFSHGKNFYWADYVNDKRRYFPWDLDAAIRSTTADVYDRGRYAYDEIILNNPTIRLQYDRLLLDLVDGPLAPEELMAFLDQIEPVLTPALQADPNSKVGGDVAGHFDSLRQWAIDRMANVRWQVLADMPVPGDANRDGTVGIADLSALADHYGAAGATWEQGDFNGDGIVGIADLSTLADNYGHPGAAAVPEPAALGLLAAGALALLLRRRRRR